MDHPNSVVKKGQKLQVLVLDIDEERDRIALGLKQLLPDPWKKAAKNYKVGQVVPVKILRLAATVAFVELEPGVEAIIPISEMSEERINKPEDVISVGQEVEGRIKSIQPNQRRITVSLRAAAQERERRETRSAVREVNQRVQEDSQVMALLRRFLSNLIPQSYHVLVNGSPVAEIRQNFNPFLLRLTIDFSLDTRRAVDHRLGLAVASMLGTLEGRQD